jgi:hypothetical protein
MFLVDKTGEPHKLNEDTLNKFSRLIVLYVDNSPELELQALYAIQAFVTRLQHPPSKCFCQLSCLEWE